MNSAKILAALGLAAMTGVLIYGFTQGNFGADGSLILKNPWGIVSLVDLYTGFFLFSGWIVYREGVNLRSFLWVIAMMVLGFFTASLYALIALFRSQGDWKLFWMGTKASG
jgi:hypothetical protein